ncbi:MAG: hypothetical protein ND895_19790, partial [Pyrinomonadaceae bacterium]|nr:hypothetical protein [Pyrinomonadaceae bacterium]
MRAHRLVTISLALLISALTLLPVSSLTANPETLSLPSDPTQSQYPFQNPELPIEERVANIISLLTIEEKIACLGTNPSVPRLGIKGSGHVEGIHGLTQGGPGKWGRPKTIPSTTFPQGIGLGETWDAEIVRQAAAVEGLEARYVFQSKKYQQGG